MSQSVRPTSFDQSTEPALRFAGRILQKVESPVTHLKLQKLTFYAYGAILADDLDQHVGQIEFEAWKHGPVCPRVYEEYKSYGSGPLTAPSGGSVYSVAVEGCLRDVLAVYGRLSAWQLREESHHEKPWIDAFTRLSSCAIETKQLREHFKDKLKTGKVTPPEGLTQIWSLALDSIPQASFDSLYSLARALS